MADPALPDASHDPGHDAGHANGSTEGPKASILDAVPHSETQVLQKVLEPRYSTRGTAPGHRGCWAVRKDGEPCGAARRADSEYCNAHSGYGVATDPVLWSAKGRAKAAENRRRRATLKATLGIRHSTTPKGLLKAMVFAESEKIAAAALDGATSLEVSVSQRASHALKLIELLEPSVQIGVSMTMPDNAEGVESLTLSQLLSLAEQEQIVVPQSLQRKD